jgi:hypothetical protein
MTRYGTAALALAGALALSVTSASAQWRGHRGHHHWGPGVAAGVMAGALIGSAVAARPYYGGGYYYAEPSPSYGYYEAPVAGYWYDDTQSRSPSRNWYGRYNCGGSYGQGRDCTEGDTGR